MIKIICTCREGSSLTEGSHFLNCPMLKQNQPTKPEESIGAVEVCGYIYPYTKAVCGLPMSDQQHQWKQVAEHTFQEPNHAFIAAKPTSTERPKSEEECPKCGMPTEKGIVEGERFCTNHPLSCGWHSAMESQTLPAKTKWKPGMCVAHLEFNCHDYGKYNGKHNVSAMFEDCLPEVQRALNGKSEEKWEKNWNKLLQKIIAIRNHPPSASDSWAANRILQLAEEIELEQEGTK